MTGQKTGKHDHDTACDKVKRIKAIQKERLEPIIRVIASGLTKHEALLYTTHGRASLDRQPKTITFIEKEFEIDLRNMIV